MDPQARARVLILGPTPPPYHGVATFTHDLLQAASPEFQCIHLDTSDRRDAGNLGRWDPRNIELGFAHLGELALRALRTRPEIVYIPISQNAPAFLRDALFALQARALGSRVVLHLHGGYFRTLYNESSTAFQSLAARVLRAASAVVVLGENLRTIFEGLVPPERIHVVENGVPDCGAWTLRGRSDPATHAFPTLAFMSTLTPEKGALELLAAARLLAARFPALDVRLAGTYPDRAAESEFNAQLNAHGLHEAPLKFTLVGAVTGRAKAEFLASADLFCLPTRYRYEGQPLVLLEALSAGLPIVSTQHAAIPSTVLPGETGTLVAKDAPPEILAEALGGLLADRARLAEMSRACRRRYEEKYTLEQCHTRLFAVFRGVLDVTS